MEDFPVHNSRTLELPLTSTEGTTDPSPSLTKKKRKSSKKHAAEGSSKKPKTSKYKSSYNYVNGLRSFKVARTSDPSRASATATVALE